MLEAKDSQFRLGVDGVISYQHQESNPLPGVPVAHLEKGADILHPAIVVDDAHGQGETVLQARLQDWFRVHLKNVVELLVALEDENTFKQPVKEILSRVHDAMGIVPREELEETIAKLDADDRKDLRSKRIRLGPILVFIPALNKPAAVKLRAMLWALYHGESLPAKTPNDGMVSAVVECETVNKDFYQSIGYPVFGPRAIRIDMLDRVICAVYDAADKGKFQAKHEMAEWLGCPIDDLYKILEAMGHKRIIQEQKPEAQTSETQEEALKVAEVSEQLQEDAKPQVKPELDWFYLKRGKAFEKAGEGKPYKKPAFKKPQNERAKQKSEKGKGKRNKSNNRSPKIMSAEAKSNPDDNPFAILGQLKK